MADEIDPLGADPVYRQLAAIIARRIRSGRLQPDRPIPSEAQMEQEFGVARGTARKAVEVLRAEGLVRTVTGKGTFVLAPDSPGDAAED
jgi:DNA-binding GntR family transcriptional regulator